MARRIEFQYDLPKARSTLLYMAKKGVRGLDQYKACKLLFLADKRHLVRYGRPITGDKYFAVKFGPIPSETRDLIKALVEEKKEAPNFAIFEEAFELDRDFSYPRLIARQEFDADLFSKSDIEVLDEIILEYGSKSFDELKAITHGTVAFCKAWKEDGSKKSFLMAFEDFFEEDENAIKGAFEEMKENFALRKYLAK